MRKTIFANNEYYHIFNRGVDKRNIFMNEQDFIRFFQSIEEFNTLSPIGSIYENSFKKNNQLGHSVSKCENLVEFVAYCLNQNHYHFILKQVADRGIEKFMHRLGMGYAKYFNEKNERSGALFQGPYKAIHVSTNEYLLHLSAYVNLNDKVHKLGHRVSKSSLEEYLGEKSVGGFCNKDIIINQFNNIDQYKKFAESSLEDIIKRKDMSPLLME